MVSTVTAAAKDLVDVPVDSLVNLFDEFSGRLLRDRDGLNARYPGAIPFIADFCRGSRLQALLDTALGSRSYLDTFAATPQRPDRVQRAFPRGLIVHWLSGNVPTLAFLSLIQGTLTKNANIIKLPSDADNLLAELLGILATLDGDGRCSGAHVAATIAALKYDKTAPGIGETLSQNADVRVIWGSDDSVKAIRALPAKIGVQDIPFSSRMSLMMVSRETLADHENLEQLGRRMAMDISIFEQKACASPHTIFMESKAEEDVQRLATALLSGLERTLRRLPKVPPSSTETTAILNARAEYDMFHQAWYSRGLEYTILHDDLVQIGPALGNRTVFLRCVEQLSDLAPLLSGYHQTIGLAAPPERLSALMNTFGKLGVQRFTTIGSMTQFEIPWDGFYIPQIMVRWVSGPKP